MSVDCKEFGYHLGYRCDLFTLKNENGYSAEITNFGATLKSLSVPNKNGGIDDIVLGYDTLEEYVHGCSYFGATIGRVANRISDAKFSLNGTVYKLNCDCSGNTLHGGGIGYDKRVWTVDEVSDGDEPFVTFKYFSPDGEEHFPGDVAVSVKYRLTKNGIRIEYKATSSADTPLSLTNHSYFNLKGEGNGDVKDHIVQIPTNRYTPVDEKLIPTGTVAYTTGTPFDFASPKPIGMDMDNGRLPEGYDCNFLFGDRKERVAATAFEETSGRFMTVTTDMPAVQMYIGTALNNVNGKNGNVYGRFMGLCFETQFCPDSPNKPMFPSCILKKGEEFTSETEYSFEIRE